MLTKVQRRIISSGPESAFSKSKPEKVEFELEKRVDGTSNYASVNGFHPILVHLLERSPEPGQLSREIFFEPFVHPTPGKSKVNLKGILSSGSFIEVEYAPSKIPNPLEIERNKIKLASVPSQLIGKARLIANALKEEWKKGNKLQKEYKELRKKYLRELQISENQRTKQLSFKNKKSPSAIKAKETRLEYRTRADSTFELVKNLKEEINTLTLSPNSSSTTMEVFSEIYSKKVIELMDKGKKLLPEDINDELLKTLTAFLCLKSAKNKTGFFKMLPHGLFNYEDPKLLEKVEILGRYTVVNLLGINTAKKAEEFDNWTGELYKSGLQQISKLMSGTDLLKFLFPGYLDGSNPPIREWLVHGTNKWQGENNTDESIKNNIERAIKAAIASQEGVINNDKTINFEKFKEIDWGQIFNDKKYGLKGAMGVCIDGTLDALEQGIPGIFSVYPKHRFKYPNKWAEENKLILQDEITRFIVEKKLNLLDTNGRLNKEKVIEISDWHGQYNEECTGCLSRSGLQNAYNALKRVYPESFGWNEDQIHPGDIRYGRMWRGENGVRLFQLRFAKSIHTVFEKLKGKEIQGFKNHRVKFNPHDEYPLYLTKKDFINLKNIYQTNGFSWYDHMLKFNLTSGFADVGKSLENTFEILFGQKSNKGTFGSSDISIEDIIDRNPLKTLLVARLLKEVEIDFNEDSIQIDGIRKDGYGENHKETGVEHSCLAQYLGHRPPTDTYEITQALYDSFAAACLSLKKKDMYALGNDRMTALEKILTNTFTSQNGFEELMLSERRLSHLLKFLYEEVIDKTNLDEKTKLDLKDLILKIRKLKRPHNNPREVFQEAIDIDKKYSRRTNNLNILNAIFEHLYEVIAIYELRLLDKFNGAPSNHFIKVYEKFPSDEESLDTADEDIPGISVEEKKETLKEHTTESAIDDEIFNPGFRQVTGDTLKICSGLLEEDKKITQNLLYVANDETQHKKYLQGFLALIDGGDLPAQVRLLDQIQKRSQTRNKDRYNYSTYRAKVLPTSSINLIVHKREEDEKQVLDTSLIEKELLLKIPRWWPNENNIPKAIPLLYWNNVLHVGVKEENASLVKEVKSNLPNIELNPILLTKENWEVLLNFYKTNYQYSDQNPEIEPLNPFIGKEEEKSIIHNMAHLRKAASIFNGDIHALE